MPLVTSRGFNMNPDIGGMVQRGFAFGDRYRRKNLEDERRSEVAQAEAQRNRQIQEQIQGAFGQPQQVPFEQQGGQAPAWGGGQPQPQQSPPMQQGLAGQTTQPQTEGQQGDPNQNMTQYREMINQQAQQQGESQDQALRNLFRMDPAIGKKALEGIDLLDKRANRKAADWAFNAEQLDPQRQEEAILARADEIVARGGNPSNTLGLMNLTPENRQFALQNMQVAALTNEERISRADAQAEAAGETEKAPTSKGVLDTKTGKQVFATNEQIQADPERYVPVPKKGEIIEVDADGNVRISRGVTEPAGNLDKKVRRDLESTITQNTANIDELNKIETQFNEDFLTYGGKISATISNIKSKAGIDLSSGEKKFVRERRRFTQNVNRVFNAYRKQITGAAAAVAELNDLKKAAISEDLSPAEFGAALDELREGMQRGNRISRKLLREGVKGKAYKKEFNDAWKYGDDDSSDDRLKELQQAYIHQDMAQEEAQAAALDQMIVEGYE